MYYPVNNFNNCSIFNKSLFQDLADYDLLLDNSMNLSIKYSGDTTTYPINFRIDELLNLVSGSPETINLWQPAFISSDSDVDVRHISKKTINSNPIFGISNFCNFAPKFKNWDIVNDMSPNASMRSDWYINSILGSQKILYGIMFWYKYIDTGYSNNMKYDDLLPRTKFFLESSIGIDGLTIPAYTPMVKINNDSIEIIDKKHFKFISNTAAGLRSNRIDFNQETYIITISQLKTGLSSLRNNCKLYKDNVFIKNNKNIELYISNGDCFSYYYGQADSLRNIQDSMPTRTYLSPALHKIYREIYHRLTIRKNKSASPSMSLYRSRLFQKLCYYLSTGPLMDRTTIDILQSQDIYDAVQSYLSQSYGDPGMEQNRLKNIFTIIYNKYIDLSASYYDQTLLSNHISTKKDLFKTIVSKYGSSLYISGKTTLKFKKLLENGPHANISTNYQNWRPKNTPTTAVSFNNNKIKIGNITYQTNISPTNSTINIRADNWDTDKNIEIPLADISLKKQQPGDFYLGPGLYTPETEKNYENEIEFRISPTSSSTDRNVTYFWEQVGGPNCLRFDNYAKNRFLKYKTSTNDSPSIFVKQPGTYKVKCTRSNYGRIDSDILTLTTSPTTTLTDINQPSLSTITDYPKIITSNIKHIAFNKRGLIWIIDSDNYVDTDEFTDYEDIDTPGIIYYKNIKFDINNTSSVTVQNNNAVLELTFDTIGGNSIVSLFSISIENMRDEQYKYCQCKSFYQEKIKRKRLSSNTNIPVLGSSDFYRESTLNQYRFIYNDINGKIRDRSVTLIDAGASTKYAPPILPYGGYGKDIIDTIGIKMPGHPNALPGYLTSPTEAITNLLPVISDRNNILSIDPQKPIACHLREVSATDAKHYTQFTKGHFHPISGWLKVSSSTRQELQGKSNVVNNKASAKNSYIFDGLGFASIKSLNSPTTSTLYSSSIRLLEISTDEENKDQIDHYGFNNKNFESKYNPNYVITEIPDSWEESSDSCGSAIKSYKVDNVIANKTIKNLEINLNFLNHINPKNLVVWLEISNITNPVNGIISADTSDFFMSKSISNNSLNSYLSALSSANTSTSSLKIQLLNQEYISNYTSNFSIKFSDYANKFNSLTQNNYNNNIQHLNIISNHQEIQPSIVVVNGNYNDMDVSEYSSIIKNNQINNINNTLSKFNSIKLKDTIFTLYISNVEPLETENSIMDNLLNNNLLNSESKFDSQYFSNILADNLCKWSVIVHTDDTRDNVDTDLLGFIDYKNSVANLAPSGYGLDSLSSRKSNIIYNGNYTPVNSSGYDFIGNFANKNFLIPLVNQNAPYQYLSNISKCSYDDPDMPSFISALRPGFPSLINYQLIGGAMGLANLGLVGAMAGLSLATAAISQGGRNDPIINYFIDNRNYNLSVQNNSQVYKPVYSQENYGYGDRAIIAISKDGAIWYNVEVPIFKYSNTPVIHKNVYKYIKLNRNAPDILSKFSFKVLNAISDLDLANSVGSVSSNIVNKNGLINIDNLNLKQNDIILLNNQTQTSDNGYWCVDINDWKKIPSHQSLYYLSYNNIGSEFVDSLSNPNTLKKNVIIDGIRAYNFFDKGEVVEIAEPAGTVTVLDKSIISTNQGQKTILTLSSELSSDSTIFKQESASNVIFLYKDSCTSTSIDNSYIPFNIWSHESSDSYTIKSETPNMRITTIGEGSIGWGTDSIFPSIISKYSLQDNLLLHTDDIFNNTHNDLYNLYKVTITDYNNATTYIDPNQTDTPQNKIKASAYSYDNSGLTFNSLNNTFNNDNEINSIIKNIYKSAILNQKNKVLLDLKSDKFKSLPESGYITLEGNSLFYKTTKFSSDDINTMNNRLKDLLSIDNQFDTNSVTDIYTISSIANLIKYYNSLPDDPIRCSQPLGPDQDDRPSVLLCQKLLAKKRIKELYQEKVNIDKAIAINNPDIEQPHISGIITNNLPIGLTIDYKENSDLYWIHIDPNQTCKINDELTVKVFKNGYFYPLPMLENIVPSNIITPDAFASNSFQNADPNSADILYKWNGSVLEYSVPESKVQQAKQSIKTKYPSLVWNDDGNFTYGQKPPENDFSNSKKVIINDGQTKDYVIQLKEEYIRPAGLQITGKVSELFDLANLDNLYVKFRNLPRKLKSVDSESFKRYAYDYNGSLVKDNKPASSVGQIANNFICWHCFNTNGIYVTDIPPFLKAANEMRYRAFFGSIDGIENKNTSVSDSQEDWEWIPFEYYTDNTT